MSANENNVFEMSDEEVMNMSAPPLDEDIPESNATPEPDTDITENVDESDDNQSQEEEHSDEAENQEEDYSQQTEEENTESNEVDYKAVYAALFDKPIKANGKEIKVNTPEEAIQLMQMGANYNKKMAAINEKLPVLKALENHNLLDVERLSFLIDINEGKPEAIAKLLKDNEVDLYDFNMDSADSYVPVNKAPNYKELEIQTVLDDIKETPTYNKTINIVGNVWDDKSRLSLVDNPELIKVINTQVEVGLFDTVWGEVERQRTFGNLTNMSDFDAYIAVGDAMNEKGLLNSFANTNPMNQQIQLSQNINNQKQEEINRKKKAASVPATKKQQPTTEEFNPLALSDEEFAKINLPHLR